MKRLLKIGDARRLAPSGLGLDAEMAKQAIINFANNPTYGGVKELIAREGTSYSSYGLVSDDYQYIFEAYEFKNNRDEKWCAIVIAPVDKILAGSISSGDLGVSAFVNDEQIYRIGDIEGWVNGGGGVTAADGTTPTFNNRYVNIANE